jgi:hypothetical protein
VSMWRQTEDGRWLPAEPMPEPFGVLWERLWHDRRRSGEWKWSALIQSWLDARAITRLADEAKP